MFSFALSFLLIFVNICSQPGFVYALKVDDGTGSGGFNLSLNWNRASDSQNMEWNSSTDEDKLIRLNVGYSNSEVDKGYEPGELTITVPGIGSANRGSVIQAADVAADKSDSTEKVRDWSYTYDKSSDTYTFTNNNKIDEKSNFSGSFEILWKFNSRDTKNDYSKEIQATLSDSEGSMTSNTVSFHYTSEKDRYTISERSDKVSSIDGLGNDYTEYIWVKWIISSSLTEKARGATGLYYKIDTLEGAVAKYALANKSRVSMTKVDDYYKVEYNTNYPIEVVVGYPKDTYNNSTVNNPVSLIGKYYDEGNQSVLSKTDSKVYINYEDYDFEYDGDIVGIDKKSSKQYLEYQDVIDGTGSDTFNLNLILNNLGDTYDVVLYDDVLDIKLSNGGFRRLTDDEYHFNSVSIPGTNSLKDGSYNNIDANKYNCKIFVRYKDTSDYVFFDEKIISHDSQLINLPENVVGIKYYIENLDVSIKYSNFPVNVTFHINEDDTLIDKNGFIRNLDAVELYKNDVLINTVDEDSYVGSWASSVAERDLQIYGHYMQRGFDDVELKVVESVFSVSSDIEFSDFSSAEKKYNSALELTTKFETNGKKSNKIVKFSQYTILDEGLKVTEDDFEYSISNMGLFFIDGTPVSDSYISEHVNVDIIKNYKDSNRIYIKFDFDFSDVPLYTSDTTSKGNTGSLISSKFPVFITEDGYLEYGESYIGRVVSMIHNSDPYYTSNYSGIDDGTYFGIDEMLWSDLDNDDSTSDIITYNSESSMIIQALSSYQEVQKSVKSNYTDDEYVTTGAKALVKDRYSYKLKFRTGNSKAKNVVIYDSLENEEGSAWKGKLIDIDTSYLQEQGYEPIVYYSSLENPGSITENRDNWSTEIKKDTKIIALDLGDTIVPDNSLVYFIINMETPDELIENKAINSFDIDFNSVDIITGLETGQTELSSNSVDVTMSDPIGEITLIKKDAVNGQKLKDAVYTLYNNDGSIYKDNLKTNNLGKIVVKNVPFGSYYFVEKTAPVGYELDSSHISVEVDNMKIKVTAEDDRLTGSVKLHKTDSEKEEITVKGATYSIYKAATEENDSDTLIKSNLVTDESGYTEVIDNLPWGIYYFIETEPADGFEINTDKVYFTIEKNNVSETITVKTTDIQKPATVKLVKSEILEDGKTASGNTITDAYFDLYDIDGKLIKKDLRTDESGMITLTDMPYGAYYFIETSNKGYIVENEHIYFTLDPNSLEEYSDKIAVQKIEMSDNSGSYPWTEKVDGLWVSGNKGVSSSISTVRTETFTLTKAGELSFEWACSSESASYDYLYYSLYKDGKLVSGTGESTKIGGNSSITDENELTYVNIIKNLEPGTYYLEFSYRKDSSIDRGLDAGYVKNLTVEKSLLLYSSEFDDQGNLICTVNAENVRKSGSATLYKTGLNSQPLKDAVYTLYDADTDEIVLDDLTTNVEGMIDISDLKWGNYYFIEKEAPNGYELSDEKLSFTVDRETVEANIIVSATDEQIKGSVILTKVDSQNTSITLKDAVYTLYDVNGKVVKNDLVSDDNGEISVGDLEWGSYYFLEKTAPAGYSLSSEKIRFSVNALNAATVQKLTAKDSMDESYEITLTKKIRYDETWFEHGNPTFVFKVEGQDINGNDHTYYKEVVFDENYVNEHNEDGYITKSVTFTGLAKGSYTASELDSIRYELKEITDVVNGTLNEKTVVFDFISNGEMKGSAVFENDKFTWKDYSHNDVKVNIIKSSKMPTGISVNSKIEIQKTETIDRSKLEVVVYYDDGTSKILNDDEYTLNPDIVSEDMNGDLTVTVSYVEKNITMVDTFVLTVHLSAAFKADIYNNRGTNIGSYDTGEYSFKNSYSFDDINYMDIRGYTGSSKVVVFPSNIDGYRVNCLGDSSFITSSSNKITGLESVNGIVISEGIQKIGSYAFYSYDNLSGNLIIPNGIKSIGDSSFEKCSGFTGDLIIPDSVTSIGDDVFNNCVGFNGKLKLSNNISAIPQYAFYKCNGFIGDLVIPDKVTIIDNYAFYSCTGFNGKLTISDSVTTIDIYAFSHCSGFTGNLTIGDSVTTIGDRAFYSCSGFTGNLTIPDSVTSIGNSAFYSCSGFTGTLTIGENMTTIKDNAFWKCSGFTGGLIIPDSVTTIGDAAFLDCTGFTGNLTIGNNVTDISYRCFENVNFTGDLVIPDSVKSIEDRAFCNCKKFTGNLIIGDGVETIYESAFYGCKGFNGNLTIGDSVITIEDSAFENCTGFTGDLIIPNSVTSIGSSAFRLCSGFTGNLTIGSSVTSIGDSAFMNCSGFTGELIIPDSVTSIEDSAFRLCSGFTGNLTIPDSVTNIGSDTFSYCSGLTGIASIGKGITSIESSLFFNCSNLSGDIIIPANINFLSMHAFNSTSRDDLNILDSITILNDNITIIAETSSAYYSMTNTIKGWSGSTAEKFANENGFTFIPLDESDYPQYSISINEQYTNIVTSSLSDAVENQRVELTCFEEGKIVDSFKINGTDVNGNTFNMPDGDVNITDISIVDGYIVESEHYPYNSNVTYFEKIFDNTKSINIDIEYDLYDSSFSSDALKLYTKQGGSYNNYLYGKGHVTYTYETDYLKISMGNVPSYCCNYYGFRAVIKPVYE